MIIWLDAQFPPSLAPWLSANFDVEALALRDLGLRDAGDVEIFEAARAIGATLISKDADFVDLVMQRGAPPKLIWLTAGNLSNASLRTLLSLRFVQAIEVLKQSDIVEVR